VAKSSTFAGLAAVLFTAALVLMFIALFHERSPRTALAAGVLFAAAVACWIRSAQIDARPPPS
jgi:hypothetical protein